MALDCPLFPGPAAPGAAALASAVGKPVAGHGAKCSREPEGGRVNNLGKLPAKGPHHLLVLQKAKLHKQGNEGDIPYFRAVQTPIVAETLSQLPFLSPLIFFSLLLASFPSSFSLSFISPPFPLSLPSSFRVPYWPWPSYSASTSQC